jgi:hypothetical protein
MEIPDQPTLALAVAMQPEVPKVIKPKQKRVRQPLPNTKVCKGCQRTLAKEIDFYKAGDNTYQSRCKTYGCHSAFRKTYPACNGPRKNTYVKKGTGPARLPDEKKDVLKNMLKEKKSLKVIAVAIDVKYPTLASWKKKGLL